MIRFLTTLALVGTDAHNPCKTQSLLDPCNVIRTIVFFPFSRLYGYIAWRIKAHHK